MLASHLVFMQPLHEIYIIFVRVWVHLHKKNVFMTVHIIPS